VLAERAEASRPGRAGERGCDLRMPRSWSSASLQAWAKRQRKGERREGRAGGKRGGRWDGEGEAT
jgi:hypothetical protein